MRWVPVARLEVEKVAEPLFRDPAPSVVFPSLKVTVSPFCGAPIEELTAAVKVTLWLKDDGLAEDATAVVVAALAIVSLNVADELPW